MSRAEFCTANRRNWDERVAIHRRDATGFYAIERFLAGEKRLHAIESGELGEVSGKRLIHLQCHFGLDTLILARAGAIATGLDFSPAAIAEARRLATEIGIAADFVCADVYDARQAVEGEFDIALTTWGTICWLPDIVGWAETIRRRNGAGNGLGIRTRQLRGDEDRRRVDVGQGRHRQQLVADQPEQQDCRHQHRGSDRPADERR
jgi:Methyltransferase domain